VDIQKSLLINPSHDHDVDNIKKLLVTNRLRDALKLLIPLIKDHPDDLDLNLFLIFIQTKLGLHRKCLDTLNQLIKKNIQDERIHLYRALNFEALGMYKAAIESYQDLIKINPSSAQALNNLGILFQKSKQTKKALMCIKQAIDINPNYSPAFSTRALIFKELGLYSKAINAYKKSLELNPHNPVTHNNLAILLSELGEDSAAIDFFNKSIGISKNYANAYFNKAEHLLKMGNYSEGWDLYEWRWKTRFRKKKPTTKYTELNLSSNLNGKEILVYGEGGFGDILMFGRYLGKLSKFNAKITVMLPKELLRIFRDSFKKNQFYELETPPPEADFQCSMMSFPKIFGTSLHTIPSIVPYIIINQELQNYWNKIIGQSDSIKIGIVWSGNNQRNIDKNPLRSRSIRISSFSPLFNLPLEFHALQKELTEDDLNFLMSRSNIKTHQTKIEDFSDTGAIISQMDLIISIDTSIAHLAGALGKPLWILVPEAHDYRWVTIDKKNLWYPTVTTFKKDRFSSWENLILQVIAKLKLIYNIA
jgi:tetratricopeptide (TPR) repeat protein